jgi:hypothetical protein
MTFEEVQREYDVTADDIRAALRFVGELAERLSGAVPTVPSPSGRLAFRFPYRFRTAGR